MPRLCNPLFWVSILSGIKLVFNAFGVTIIADDQINNIANGFAAIFTAIGIASSWRKNLE